jgi:hypothetical protein
VATDLRERSVIERELAVRRREQAIARLASRQHGVVSRSQLLALGLGAGAIRHRIGEKLHVVQRAVYAVGHPTLTRNGQMMAAVLTGGGGAALSHASAAELWGLRPVRAALHVTTRTRRVHRGGLHFHHSHLPEDEMTACDAIPVTTVPRTILDLAATLPERAVERCINEAEIRRLWDRLSLTDLLDRYPGRPGTPTLRAILARRGDGALFTRRELEFRFLRFLADAGLPPPTVNQPLWVRDNLFEVDCLWRRERVVVELDSRTYHHTDRAFERDRRRHRMLEAAGWRTAQVTWRQLHEEPAELEADLRRLLSTLVAA